MDTTTTPLTTDQKLDPKGVDDTRMTVNEFMSRIALAQSEGLESIEASDNVIAHFNKRGLNGSKYFIYAGIKVYPLGMTEEIEEAESVPSIERNNGTGDGIANRLETGK